MAYSEPGIFNVLDPWLSGTSHGMVAGSVTAAQAEVNAQILQAAITAAQASQSGCPSSPGFAGTILFPGHSVVPLPVGGGGSDAGDEYQIAVPAGQSLAAAIIIECNWPLLFLGTGNVKLTLVTNTLGQFGDMFWIQSNVSQDADLGGITFENLWLKFKQTSSTVYAAVHVAAITSGGSHDGGQNIRLVRCIFDDCPVGVWFEQTQQGNVLECTALYNGNTGTCIKIGNGTSTGETAQGKEIYIAGCTFRCNSTGTTGILILASEHIRVTNTRLEGFTQGIVITPGPHGKNALRCFFSDVTVYVGANAGGTVGTGLLIQPQSTAQQIAQMTFVGCLFEPGDSQATSSGGAGIIVDPNGSVIDTVRFVSCYSCRWPGPGIMIKGGNNIEITGGMYAGNNLGGSATQPYGVYIGAAVGVRIANVSCIGRYNYVTTGNNVNSPLQSYGIYIDLNAQEVIITGCDLRGNSTNGVFVNGGSGTSPTNVIITGCDLTGYSGFSAAVNVNSNVTLLKVTNCAGYNDLAVTLSAPPTPPPASTTTFHNYDFQYYGPVAFYIWSGTVTHVHIDGNDTTLSSGGFTLGPGERASLNYSAAPNFVMVGK